MEILLGVSGGIAAYKAIDLLRILQRRGHGVSVVMTAAAARFVGPGSFAALSGRRVGLSQFEPAGSPGYPHLEFARAAELMVVAPASANTIARMAAGLADDLLTGCYVAFEGPVLVAPAMNQRMYLHPATIENLARLRAHGVEIVQPGSGLLADGETGVGRLASPEAIADAVEARAAASGPLRGRRVLVSAGGTREPLDPVRFIGNRSSGRMGFAIAEAAHRRGAEVTVLAANVDLPRRAGIRYVEAPTAAALHEAALAEFDDCDLLVMAAAVADYRPATAAAGKLKRASVDELEIRLERTADILVDLVGRRQRQVLVGFAAETGAGGLEEARSKRLRKGLDMLVYNDVSAPGAGFESEANEITVIGPGAAEETFPRMSKAACADRILDAASPLLAPSS
jgi:phosphopantothenoylcysteine decarboxylase / phosphopantothenate---cysteine ligase